MRDQQVHPDGLERQGLWARRAASVQGVHPGCRGCRDKMARQVTQVRRGQQARQAQKVSREKAQAEQGK